MLPLRRRGVVLLHVLLAASATRAARATSAWDASALASSPVQFRDAARDGGLPLEDAPRRPSSDALAVAATGLEGRLLEVRRGGGLLAGLNPLGYKMTALGSEFLAFDGSRDSDLGRLLSSLKQRKRTSTIKSEWLELVRFSKTGQAVRVYKDLDRLLSFLLAAGLIA